MKALILSLLLFCACLNEAGAQLLFMNYGSDVAVAGDEILVSEPNSRYREGIVYVYSRAADGTWTERARLTAPDRMNYDGFGAAIANDGEHLLISASRKDQGRVYVFGRDGKSWSYKAVLEEPGLSTSDGYGTALAIEGGLAVVGAPGKVEMGSAGHPQKPGTVYVYRRDAGGAWQREGAISASDASNAAAFGRAVAIVDGRIIAGAPGSDERTGVVYVFEKDSGTWKQAARLSASSPAKGASFGASIVAADGKLVVGGPGGNPSIVTVFTRGDGQWTVERTLQPAEGGGMNWYGYALAADGARLLIASPFASQGAGTIYVRDGASEVAVTAEDGSRGDFFGGSLAAGDDLMVVGALGDDGMAGTAKVFERQNGMWTQTAVLRSEPAHLKPITGEVRDCTEGAAEMFDCSRVDLLSFLPVDALGGKRGVMVNDLWGWTDPMSGREYVLQGRTDGTSFVDISDPSNPIFVGDLPLTEGANPALWRDMKVYKDHVYIVADNAGEHGVQVFDLTRLRDVKEMPARFKEETVYRGINSAHNIAINEETGFAYSTGNGGGGETCGGGLHMIDIREPKNPKFAGCFSHEGTGFRGTGYTHDAQCVIYKGPDAQYRGREICFSANETALSIGDVTDKADVKYLSQGSYPASAYVHQGWLSEDHRYFYIDDEGDEIAGNVDQTRTLIWDVSDLDDPQFVKGYTWGERSSDHNLYIRGNVMYQSNYVGGLRVHDISDPENPKEIGYFDTVPVGDNGPGFAGSWSNYPYFKSEVIAVSSMQEGLFLVKKQTEPGL